MQSPAGNEFHQSWPCRMKGWDGGQESEPPGNRPSSIPENTWAVKRIPAATTHTSSLSNETGAGGWSSNWYQLARASRQTETWYWINTQGYIPCLPAHAHTGIANGQPSVQGAELIEKMKAKMWVEQLCFFPFVEQGNEPSIIYPMSLLCIFIYFITLSSLGGVGHLTVPLKVLPTFYSIVLQKEH